MSSKFNYYEHFGWVSNPFTLNIVPDVMVGYSSQIDSLLSHVYNQHKIAIVIGHTGSGKTTLLNWINNKLNEEKDIQSFYIPKPPKEKEDLILVFKNLLGFNIFDKLQISNININNLPKYITKKTRKNQTVFLIDEAHECSIDVLEWLRTITDMVPNMSLILAGLPIFKDKLETELTTLSMRVTSEVFLESLDHTETESLIMKRIEKVGGKGTNPFNSESIEKIFQITGGFPREIIKRCNLLVAEAAKKNLNVVNKTFVVELFSDVPEQKKISVGSKTIKLDIDNIPSKQMKILEVLAKNPNSTPSKIVKIMDPKNYKNKNNALRSINNILRRLMRDGLIDRKKHGKSFVYYLSGKSKSLFAEA